jgi:cardiolipin synthase (CMP-forming)
MSLPNLITIARILIVPVTIWLIVSGEYALAFLAFLAAGVSDGVDGFIAKRFDLRTELGAYLDPLADKLLLVSIYVSLGVQQLMPAWLVILVASRDVLIVGAVILSWVMKNPVELKPSMVSKANTVGQILLAGSVLGVLGLKLHAEGLLIAGYAGVAALTVISGTLYMLGWIHHMANGREPAP